jgi:uncharacterized membrane protein YozB (DUF420 family)
VQQTGFLGTAAPWPADVTLLLEIGMGMGLLTGALLARAGRYRLHATCQSIIVIFNLGLVALLMFPSFRQQVSPKLPEKIAKPFYAFAVTHAVLGGLAQVGGLYILLGAGTKLLPEKMRIKRFKFWMRIVLAAWWLVLLLGLATYARRYVPHLFRR